jgi:hypothetical protein
VRGKAWHALSCCEIFFFVLCTLCCEFLWIGQFWLSLRYSLTFIYIQLALVSVASLLTASPTKEILIGITCSGISYKLRDILQRAMWLAVVSILLPGNLLPPQMLKYTGNYSRFETHRLETKVSEHYNKLG